MNRQGNNQQELILCSDLKCDLLSINRQSFIYHEKTQHSSDIPEDRKWCNFSCYIGRHDTRFEARKCIETARKLRR